MEREENKKTTTRTWSIIRNNDIRLICHLAGRGEDAIYSLKNGDLPIEIADLSIEIVDLPVIPYI